MADSEAHSSRLGLYALLALCFWALYFVCSRLVFHPLAHVPGPKLAALTYLYQTYFSVAGGRSRYYLQIAKLHQIYGMLDDFSCPVVRITPDEVHLSDADNYDTIHHVGTRFTKYPRQYDAFSVQYSSFTSCSNELHRRRRGVLNTFFSRKMVLELESIVQAKAEKLCALVSTKLSSGQPADLHHAFRAVSVDVITEYGFGKSYDLLDSPDLGAYFFKLTRGLGPSLWIFQQWPELLAANKMPPWMLEKMNDSLAEVVRLQRHALEQLTEVKADMDAGWNEKTNRRTIFHEFLTPKPEEDYVVPTLDQLKDETISILTAASDTTGNAMTVAAYNVVKNPVIYKKLIAELEAAFPSANSRLDFEVLERLPYLTGIIKEALRLSFGVIGRLSRVVPSGGAVFNGVAVPAGMAVGTSTWVFHQDPQYFPDPTEFNPDRWLDVNNVRRMEKSFFPFGKGSRICVGMPLAYCELYVTLGTLFRRFETLKGNELQADDLVYDDFFASHHPLGSTYFHVTKE